MIVVDYSIQAEQKFIVHLNWVFGSGGFNHIHQTHQISFQICSLCGTCAVADLDGFWGFDRNPSLKLAQWQSKYINIAVLTICHSKQLYTTVFQ